MDIKDFQKKMREIELSEYRTTIITTYLVIMLSVIGIIILGFRDIRMKSYFFHGFLVCSFVSGITINYYFIGKLLKRIDQLRVKFDNIEESSFIKHINEFLIKRNFLGMSKCCKSSVEIVEGVVSYYVCKKCGRPCELFFESEEGQNNGNQ